MKYYFSFFLFLTLNFVFGQQNTEFKSVKNFFDYQRFMLNNEFKKKFDSESDFSAKINIKKDFSEFIRRIDSIQNTALVGALIKVKNREDLERLKIPNLPKVELANPKKTDLEQEAKYPGGFNNLRGQVADLFYSDAVLANQEQLKTSVEFVVERDGSITSVHAVGDNFTFNRQAEIAMYLLPEKFEPAQINGMPVRYRFRLPLAMNFE